MKADDVTENLSHYYFKQGICIPNVYLYAWECDFLRVTKSGYVFEYEVKVSLSDFKADFNKKSKHKRLQDNSSRKPNRFYYACPNDLIKPDEVPEYAGLIYCSSKFHPFVVKKAPMLHKVKEYEYNHPIENALIEKFRWKYWALFARYLKLKRKNIK